MLPRFLKCLVGGCRNGFGSRPRHRGPVRVLHPIRLLIGHLEITGGKTLTKLVTRNILRYAYGPRQSSVGPFCPFRRGLLLQHRRAENRPLVTGSFLETWGCC